MRKITLYIFAVTAVSFLASCGSLKLNDFARARYTKYGHNDPVIQFNNADKQESKVAAQNVTEDKPVNTINNAPAPIVVSQAESQPVKPALVRQHKKQQVVNAQPVSSTSKVNNESSNESVSNVAPENTKTNTAIEGGQTAIDPIVYILLAILISPLAVYLYDGQATSRFWIDLILWLLGVAVGFEVPVAFLLWLAAVIYAIVIVTGS